MHVGTKTISIDDEAYNRLKSQKEKNESFSDVVKKLTPKIKKKSLLEFSGKWNLSDEEKELINNRLKKLEKDFDDIIR